MALCSSSPLTEAILGPRWEIQIPESIGLILLVSVLHPSGLVRMAGPVIPGKIWMIIRRTPISFRQGGPWIIYLQFPLTWQPCDLGLPLKLTLLLNWKDLDSIVLK